MSASWLAASPSIAATALVFICVQPLLLDFCIAARGYSLGLAFFVWALWFATARRYVLCGLAMGLGIAASLSIAFGALGLIAGLCCAEEGSAWRRLRAGLSALFPTVLAAGAICYFPLQTASLESFYTGYATLHDAVFNLIQTSLRAKTYSTGVLGTDKATLILEAAGIPLVAVSTMFAAWKEIRATRQITARLLPLITLCAALASTVMAHHILGARYPPERAWLFLNILSLIAWAVAADSFRMPARLLHGAFALILILQCLSQFQVHFFQFWAVEARTKDAAQYIAGQCKGRPSGSVRISCTWLHQPALEFYRRRLDIQALRPVEWLDDPPLEGFDFYVLSGRDAKRAGEAGLRIVLRDSRTGFVLATNAGSQAPVMSPESGTRRATKIP